LKAPFAVSSDTPGRDGPAPAARAGPLIFYDWFGAVGGAEKAMLTLARGLEAEVISTDVDPSCARLAGYQDVTIRSLGRTPRMSVLKQLGASWLFYTAKPGGSHDVYVLGGSFAPYAAKRHHPNLWYCFAPPRMFYDLRVATAARLRGPHLRAIFKAWTAVHSRLDQRAVRHVDVIIAISENIRRRILKFYGRDAKVIYPPVDVSAYRAKPHEDFWLSVNRLTIEKRLELQVEAFRRLPNERLIIVGGIAGKFPPAYQNLLSNLPQNVTWLGQISEPELRDLYARCRGHITTALDEDFGLTPVEAMASGKAVVAPREGGYLETVIVGVTGRLVDVTDIEAIVSAVKEISRDPAGYAAACRKQAQRFDVARFITEMQAEIEKLRAPRDG
jgi:glycosyltransferase involved in cell wall biosynthesis